MLEFIRATDTQEDSENEHPMPQNNSVWDQKEYLEFVKHYSDDETIPKEIKESNWGIYGKALTYTFLDKEDIPLIDIFSNLLRLDALIDRKSTRLNSNHNQIS